MNSQDAKKKINKLPDSPGVYFFRHGKEILYIGKATSLRDRVRSYFRDDIVNTRGPLISKMLSEFDDIKFQKTDSVLEALILEAHLIKKHQPYANTAEKDDKSFNYVVITKEDFPRILIVRGRDLKMARGTLAISEVKYSFGPFTNGGQLKEAIKIVRKLFPFRDKCVPCDLHRVTLCKPCFNRQIGLCPGVCTGEISKKDYAKTVKNITLFFEGNKKQIVKNLEKEMKSLAKNREFEKAGKIKKQIFALNHIRDVALIKNSDFKGPSFDTKFPKDGPWGAEFRIESYDIAHMSSKNVVGVMVVVENGEAKKSDYRKFKIRSAGSGDTKALSEILSRRLAHTEWRMPNLIVVDGGIAQKNAMEKVLEESGIQIPVVSVVKDEHHKPKEILGDFLTQPGADRKRTDLEGEILLSNSEAHRFAIGYHKKLRRIV